MPQFAGLYQLFMGDSPVWYKRFILLCLLVNPLLLWSAGPFVTGWILVAQFIFTLAMALKCYPLQSGGLLALEAVLMGMTTPEHVYHETVLNFEVILLLVFMVAGIFFMREFLLVLFTRLLLYIRSRQQLALSVCFISALLSAFLDALTVTAVLITVCVGFYTVFYAVATGRSFHHDQRDVHPFKDEYKQDLADFRQMLRSLVMHGAVGTALGGVSTMVGEPQNLLIAERMNWSFVQFFLEMAHVTVPVLIVGLGCCLVLEHFKLFSFNTSLPQRVRDILQEDDTQRRLNQDMATYMRLWVQGGGLILLILALSFHVASVGLIGLSLIVLLTTFGGITKEHQLGRAFEEALPFTALLVVFFAVVAVINDQRLFYPVMEWVLQLDSQWRAPVFYLANGALSAFSDNVFVATTYINELHGAQQRGEVSMEEMNRLAVAINTGTNIPSIITPNGQAAFLFLLTSPLAPLIRLSYLRMVFMALPYGIVLGAVGFIANFL